MEARYFGLSLYSIDSSGVALLLEALILVYTSLSHQISWKSVYVEHECL